MCHFLSWYVRQQLPASTTQPQRQRLVHQLLQGAAGTHLEPTFRERHLLDHFVQGRMSIDQVLQHLTRN